METFLVEIPEHSKSRKRIEDDLIIRHKALQRKVEALKVRRSKEEIQHNQATPTINPHSRRLAKTAEKSPYLPSDRLERAHELLHNSRFFPRKAKISLEELSKSLSQTCLAKPQSTRDSGPALALRPSKSDTLLNFPSLLQLAKQGSGQTFSSEIGNRNQLLKSLREETVTRGFLTEPEEPPTSMMIHERSQVWLRKKNAKIAEMREKEGNKELVGCTFKPKVQEKKFFSLNNSHRSLSAETSYASLYERKKEMRSASKMSGVYSSNGRSDNSKSISSLNSLRLKESISSNFSPVYSPLCPVAMNVSHSGFRRATPEVLSIKSK